MLVDSQNTGKCQCGAVTYTVKGDPLRMAQCHCEDCRRASGTGHMSLAFFNEDQINISGETHSYSSTADSGNINTRNFCPKCGSRLFGSNSARTGVVAITAGTLDNSSWFKPAVIVYAAHRPAWDQMDESLPTFDKMPPPPPQS